MNAIRYFLLSVVSVFCLSVEVAYSSHTADIEMFYRWTGNTDSTYEFTIVFYRNCQGFTANAPTLLTINTKAPSINRTGNISTTRLPSTGLGIPPLQPPNMYNCTQNFNSLCYEEYVYRGLWISPQRARDWTFSYEICCRPNLINSPTNLQNGSQYIECGLNNFDFPDSKSRNWSTIWHNRRPNHPGHLNDTIINYFFKVLLAGRNYNLDASATEYQGDSVTYEFYWPQTNGGNQIAFINGWSFVNPLPSLSGNLKIDDNTGIIQFMPGNPTGTGIYMLGIQSNEWRNDTVISNNQTQIIPRRIGYNRRELMIFIEDSANYNFDTASVADIYLDTLLPNNILRLKFSSSNNINPVLCNSLSTDGSEFRIVDSSGYVAPYDSTVRYIGILGASWHCQGGVTNFVDLHLNENLHCGEYYVVLKKGSDLNVYSSECGVWESEGSSAIIHTDDPVQAPDLGPDKEVCEGVPHKVKLDAGPGYSNYNWSTWDSTRRITVKLAREYWVEVRDKFNCTFSDTIEVKEVECKGTNNQQNQSFQERGNPLSIDENEIVELRIYPNPAKDILNIKLTPDIRRVQLFDITGHQLTSQSISNLPRIQLDLTTYLSGVYFITMENSEGLIRTERIVILRD